VGESNDKIKVNKVSILHGGFLVHVGCKLTEYLNHINIRHMPT